MTAGVCPCAGLRAICVLPKLANNIHICGMLLQPTSVLLEHNATPHPGHCSLTSTYSRKLLVHTGCCCCASHHGLASPSPMPSFSCSTSWSCASIIRAMVRLLGSCSSPVARQHTCQHRQGPWSQQVLRQNNARKPQASTVQVDW